MMDYNMICLFICGVIILGLLFLAEKFLNQN